MSDDLQKDALRMMPYGFYAITSKSGGEVNIMVANWLIQCSFEPRQIALALQKTSYSHGLVKNGGVFTVNLFNKEDVEAIKPYTKGRAKNPDKMKDAKFTPAPVTGCPVVAGAAAYIECRVVGTLDSDGDHEVIVGEVVGAGVNKPGEAKDSLTLVDLGWSYAG